MRASHVLLYRMCEDATECLIYLMLVFSPWAFGSTQSWAIWTMSIAGYLLGLLLITKLSLRWFKGYPAARWSRVPGAHDSNRPSHLHGAAGIHAVLAFLTVCILGFCLVSALNARATYRSEQVSFEYHQCLNWLPHSYDSRSTWLAFWTYLGLASSFWAIVDWLLGKSENENRADYKAPSAKGVPSVPLFPARLGRLLWVLSVSGALLAVVGILQRWDGSGKLLWLVRPRINSTADLQFGPYAYRSNAAQYFNLLWPVCLGFALTPHRLGGFKNGAQRVLLASGIIMAAASILSISRGGAMVCFAILLLGTVFLLLGQLLLSAPSAHERQTKWRILMPLLLFVLASVALGGLLASKQVIPRLANLKGGYGERAGFYKFARPMAQDYPVFGTGPGTFGVMFRFYAPSGDYPWTVQLHDDWLETRITFGWFGSALIALALLTALARCLLPGAIGGNWRFVLFLWLALAGCLAHARFDFPFQVHSILFLFLILCAILVVGSGRAAARANG